MTQAYIKVIAGTYCGKAVENVVFPLIKAYTKHGDQPAFVTVDGSHAFGAGKEKIRVKVESIRDAVPSTIEEFLANGRIENAPAVKVAEAESDEVVMERISNRFEILHEMTKAACAGDIRAMIVTGPPGVGKSFGVEAELERAAVFDRIANRKVKSEVVKGGMSDIGLYQKLYEFSDRDNVLVMDDCDELFYETTTLNLLKAALDTSKVRKISWNKESRALDGADIPRSFNFKGSIIFITNIKFENIRSKTLQEHLKALESRCHYLDLKLDTTREKLLRIRQIANTGELFSSYDFEKEQEAEVIDFLFANQPKLRETSLRTALKVADLYKSFPAKWQSFAQELVMKSAS